MVEQIIVDLIGLVGLVTAPAQDVDWGHEVKERHIKHVWKPSSLQATERKGQVLDPNVDVSSNPSANQYQP